MTATLTDILRDDLATLMPGCEIHVSALPSTVCVKAAFAAKAIHRTTGRQLTLSLDMNTNQWSIYYGAGASHTGRSAYGFDSAIVHAYRHHLDFTSEYGPGTAWDYRNKNLIPAS